MKEIILAPDSQSYTMDNLMDGADYMINVFPQFNGRGNGPKSSIMGKTQTLGMHVTMLFCVLSLCISVPCY